MGKNNKPFALFLTLIIVISCLTLLTVKPANAQSIPNPSVPEFTVKFSNESYNVPAKTLTTTDPYTGKQAINVIAGYYVQNDSFVISIRNQHISNNGEVNGSKITLNYDIQWKGHFSTQWTNENLIEAAYGDYTVIVFGLAGNNDTAYNNYASGYMGGFEGSGFIGGEYGGQVDIRVSAIIGYSVTITETPNPFNIRNPYHTEFVTLKSSDWSNTQAISIPDGSVFSSSSSNPTTVPSSAPTVQEFPAVLAITFLLVTALAVAVTRRRWHET